MSDVFLRQDEAWEFVRSLEDPKEKLLTELAIAKALSFLMTDQDYRQSFRSAPLDLLTYAKAAHSFLRQQDILRGVLDGEIESIDDLNPFPDT